MSRRLAHNLRDRARLTYAVPMFLAFGSLIEYGDDQLADLGGDDDR